MRVLFLTTMFLMTATVLAGSARWEGGNTYMTIKSGQESLYFSCNRDLGKTLFINLIVSGKTALPTVDDEPAPFVLVVEGSDVGNSRLNADKGYYFSPDKTHLFHGPVDRGFLDALAAGSSLLVTTPDGTPVTRFTLAGSAAAKDRFVSSCGW